MSLPTRWILCTKWAVPVNKPPAPPAPVAGPVSSGVPAVPAEPEKPTFVNYWTPLGTPQFATRHGKHSGIPKSYTDADEAIRDLKDVVTQQPELLKQDLNFVVLEVKYVPNKIKIYKQVWFDKYVIKEIPLELSDHKFTDVMK